MRSTTVDDFFAGRGDWLLGTLFSLLEVIKVGILTAGAIVFFAAFVGVDEGACASVLKSVDWNVLDRWSDWSKLGVQLELLCSFRTVSFAVAECASPNIILVLPPGGTLWRTGTIWCDAVSFPPRTRRWLLASNFHEQIFEHMQQIEGKEMSLPVFIFEIISGNRVTLIR